ncbi:hypothetical protein BDR26DRAFT_849770 [Obelidium mucronatum]|nr:hypothetical protein BDR26DRAFT_849770 [Obelidium mucronatum]
MGNSNSVGAAGSTRLSIKALRRKTSEASTSLPRDSKASGRAGVRSSAAERSRKPEAEKGKEKEKEKEKEYKPDRKPDPEAPKPDQSERRRAENNANLNLVVVDVSGASSPQFEPSLDAANMVPVQLGASAQQQQQYPPTPDQQELKPAAKKLEAGIAARAVTVHSKPSIPSIMNTPDSESQRIEGVQSTNCLQGTSFANSRASNNSNDSYLKVNNLGNLKSGSTTISRTMSSRRQYVTSSHIVLSPMITQAVEDLEKIRSHTPLASAIPQAIFGMTDNLPTQGSDLKHEQLPLFDKAAVSGDGQSSLSSFESPSKPLPDIGESITAMAAIAKFKKCQSKKRNDSVRRLVATTQRKGTLSRGNRIGGSVFAHDSELRNTLHKFNSCSTLFIDSTLSNADLQKTLKCVATALAVNIRRNNELNLLRTDDIFSEKLRPLSKHIQFYQRILSEEDIFKFLDCIFQAAELNVECAVITLVYIERMLINTGITLHSCNWARIVLGGLLLASKVWDDHAVWNIDFCQIFPDINVKDMNDLERWYMSAMQYNVSVKASVYARYYFELRDLLDTEMRIWTAKPLVSPDISQNTAIPAINVDSSSNSGLNDGTNRPGCAPADKGGIRRSRSDYGFPATKQQVKHT